MRQVALIAAIFSVLSAFAQYSFTRWDTLKVNDGSYLINPWAGGFNNPQFSEIDLNGDAIMDLLVFDRSTDRCYTFVNGGASSTTDYTHNKYFESHFPKLTDWVLLVDYNCDGLMDIFTSAEDGIRVYRNDYNTQLQFTLVKDVIKADGFDLYVSKWDIPAIDDVDGDGDLDILTFDIPGDYMEFYENISMDNYAICDSIEYTLSSSCWGEFAEEFGGCNVYIDSTCSGLFTSDNSRSAGHAGSTTLAIDLDGDIDKELIIGDLACSYQYMLTNGGTPTVPDITAVTVNYPAPTPINISTFPAAFNIDLNNDGLKDLISAPNGISVSEDRYSAWYYTNIGTASVPVFSYQQTNVLQDGMIDVGTGATPVFFDYNSDGLQDLLVANYGHYQFSSTPISKVLLYENIGSATIPEFQFVTDDYENLSSVGLQEAIFPAFGDIDGDGDADMMIGNNFGYLHYFENIAGSGNVADFVLAQPFFQDNTGASIDVGQYAAPQIVDVNKDGLLDLLIGERDGVLNYYRNTGTTTAPEFTLITSNLGGVDVKPQGEVTGYSTPLLTILDSTGAYNLLVGSQDGYIHHYSNIDGNLGGAFILEDSVYQNIFEGNGAIITGNDINNDNVVDLIVGNLSGGVAIYKGSGTPYVPKPPIGEFDVIIYPNPGYSEVTINIGGVGANDVAEIKVYDLQGRLVYTTGETLGMNVYNMKLRGFSTGSYVAHVTVKLEQGEELNQNVRLVVFR